MAQSLGHLAATVSLDINPFKASNNVLKAQIKSTASALRAQEAALKGSANGINNMRQVYSTMTRQMMNYNAQMENSKKIMDDTTKSERARANAANQYNRTSAQVEALQRRMQSLSREIAAQSSRWGQLSARASHFGNVASTVGSKIQDAGRGMSTYLTAPIAAGLAYSAKQLVDFQDAMNRTKNVIRTSGETATQTQHSYNQMLKDARKYSDEYGVSQIKIANGYQDLVKRGYTSKAAIGVMRNELKASVATGDDFNDVIKVAAQTMESFGLSTTKTGKPLKNAALMQRRSTKTLNELAYAADATSTDFQSLGVGMSYVGATAHQAGFSLSETASAMGILSNNGLEADKAGTGLRKVIQSLITPTANGKKALQSINLTTKDFLTKSGKLKSMSAIFETLNKHMKGLSGSKKNDIFHALFGTTGQQAGAILTVNANRLHELNKEVEKSAKNDYIGDLSRKNLTSAKSQIAIARESLTNAGMDMAKNILPSIIPLIQDVSKLAQGFGKLPDSVKKAITSFVAFTAGAGPVLLLLGKLTSGVGKTALGFGKVVGGLNRAILAYRAGASGVAVLKSAFSKTAYETSNFGKSVSDTSKVVSSASADYNTAKTAISDTGKVASVAGLSMSTFAVGVGVATAAIVAGTAVWELWGKQAAASSARTSKWGSDVGAAADHALTKFKGTSDGIQSALTQMDVAAKTSTKSMSDSFDKEFSQMENDARQHLENVKKAESNMSPAVAAAVDKEAEHEKRIMNNLLDDADKARVRANTILQTSNGNIASLSQTQRVMLRNNQQQILNDELKMWSLTSSQRKKAMAVLNNDVANMTRRERSTRLRSIREETEDVQNEYNKQANSLKRQLKAGTINQNEYAAGMRANNRTLHNYVDKASAEYIRLAKANGENTDRIKRDMQAAGLSYSAGMKQISKESKNAESNVKSLAVSVEGLHGKTKSAAKMWNNLVFDPKTGKVRTNAQEEVNKAVNSSKKWNQIKLLAKQGKLSTNAGKMVAAALIENGKWNKMSWKEKKLYIKDEATQNVLKALEKSGEWNKLSMKEQEAIIKSKGGRDLADALVKAGAWNSLTMKEQEAVLKDKTTGPLISALSKTDKWNSLTLKQQEAIVNAKGTKQLVDAINQAGLWNSLTFKQQQALVYTKGTADVMQALNQMGRWNQLTPKQQQAIVNAKGGPELGNLITKYGLWRGMPASVAKRIVAQDHASGNIDAANRAIQEWQKANPGQPKNAIAFDNASGPFKNATGSVFSWNGTGAGSKSANGFDSASGPFGSATGSVSKWNGTGVEHKIAKANDHASAVLQGAINKIKEWNNTDPIVHTVKTIYETITRKHHASGTNYHIGGPMIVNDQPGPVFREAVQFPSQQPFIPFGRNVIMNAPRGTKVLKASDTLKLFPHLPQYANGTSDAVSVLNSMKPSITSQKVVTNNYSNRNDDNSQMTQLIVKMGEVVDRMGTMLGLSAAQLSAIKASAFDKDQMYTVMGRDQIYLNEQRL